MFENVVQLQIGDFFLYFIFQFWWVFLLFGIFTFLFALQIARTIANYVLFVRRGKTMEWRRCVIRGTNIVFRPNKGGSVTTVHTEADPYIMVRGLSTRRVFFVTEGTGQSSRIPDDHNPTIKDKEGNIKPHYKNVGASHMLNPNVAAASASIGLFERITTHLSTALPKTKADLMTIIMYCAISAVVGLAWGILIGRGGTPPVPTP